MHKLFWTFLVGMLSVASSWATSDPTFDSLPDVVAQVRSFYTKDQKSFDVVIAGVGDYIKKIDTDRSAEVKTNMRLFPLYSEGIVKTCDDLNRLLHQETLTRDDRKAVAADLVEMLEKIGELNRLSSEIVFKLEGSLRQESKHFDLSHVVYPYSNRAFILHTAVAHKLQIYIITQL